MPAGRGKSSSLRIWWDSLTHSYRSQGEKRTSDEKSGRNFAVSAKGVREPQDPAAAHSIKRFFRLESVVKEMPRLVKDQLAEQLCRISLERVFLLLARLLRLEGFAWLCARRACVRREKSLPDRYLLAHMQSLRLLLPVLRRNLLQFVLPSPCLPTLKRNAHPHLSGS